MAGNYPDVPSWRMAIDRDGTAGVKITGLATVVSLTNAQMILLNDESTGGFSVGFNKNNNGFAVIFPELRDLDGYFAACKAGLAAETMKVETSVNSTNGIDGTWVTIAAAYNSTDQISPYYRTAIQSSTVLSIKAVRVLILGVGGTADTLMLALHLFGEIAPAENPNRLALWHPTLDQRITPSYFDWGNTPRGSSADRTFRVKNLSTVQTANSIRVAQEILTDTVPSVAGQHTLMKASESTSFLAQVNVGALAPGAISEVVTLRRVTPSNAVLSLWCHRVFAEATTWS